jgi:cbb3-type cytochrome oxidase cytochrome c subunit
MKHTMTTPNTGSRSLTSLDFLAAAALLVGLVVGVGWVIWRSQGTSSAGVTFREIETNLAQRRLLAQVPDTPSLEQAHHAVRLARLDLALARARAAEAAVGDLEARFAELQKFTLDQLDNDNRARLDRRLRAIETDAILTTAQGTHQAAEQALAQQRTQAKQAVQQAKQAFKEATAEANRARDMGGAEDLQRTQAVLEQRTAQLQQAQEELAQRQAQWQAHRAPLRAALQRLSDAEAQCEKVYAAVDASLATEKKPKGVTQMVTQQMTRTEQCVNCHRGIDREEFDRALLARLGDEDESKRLSVKLAAARDMLEKREQAGDTSGLRAADVPGERAGSLMLVALLMVLSTLVAALSLGLLERSWRVGLNALYAGLGLTVLTSGAMAYLTPLVPRVQPVPLGRAELNQYCVHPRLDLYVGANSPHPIGTFACVDCHHGEGAARNFGTAGHTPNDIHAVANWKNDHRWDAHRTGADTMLAKRFTQASCLRCHPQVTDTIRHGVQEEAPQLLAGQRLFTELGCFGCHEVHSQRDGQTIGPDVRLESSPPGDAAAGTYRKVGPSLRRMAEKLDESWVRKWIADPRGFREHTTMPHFYGLSNNHPDRLPADQKAFPAVEMAAMSHYLHRESQRAIEGSDAATTAAAAALRSYHDRLSKGPLPRAEVAELEQAAKRVRDLAVLGNPIATTIIDDLFRRQQELHDRLIEPATDSGERGGLLTDLAEITASLRKAGLPAKVSDRLVDGDGTEVKLDPGRSPDLVRGRLLFTEKGCLACHQHNGTTRVLKVDGKTAVYSARSEAQHGPDLSRMSEKLAGANPEAARRWLVQWILNPNVHHSRTLMPITHLHVDQADDVASWLLSATPSEPAPGTDPGEPDLADLTALARLYLGQAATLKPAEVDAILPGEGKLGGLPGAVADALPAEADERVLREGNLNADSLKWYVGKKAIARQGCYGCHDIPGFEQAKPNSVPLTHWGRKKPTELAFENAAGYVRKTYTLIPTRQGSSRLEVTSRLKELEEKFDEVTPEEAKERDHLKARVESQDRLIALEALEKESPLCEADRQELEKRAANRLFEGTDGKEPFEEVFLWALEHHRREGYLHLKLADPRAFDDNRDRGWLERLVMPQFRFARSQQRRGEEDAAFQSRRAVEEADARESAMTYVLGLVGEPVPAGQRPAPESDHAIEARGRAILDKYNCGGCHQIQPGVYEFDLTPEIKEKLLNTYNKAAVEDVAGWIKDHVYPGHSGWFGQEQPGNRLRAYGTLDAAASEASSDRSDVIYLTDALRFPVEEGGHRDLRAGMLLSLPRGSYREWQGYGGTWTDLMIPYLGRKDSTNFPTTEPGKARGVLAPPLLRQGERTQGDWLYQFLLQPGVIRPENYMLLRMPKFNLSKEEARALVDYFAAVARRQNPGAALSHPYTAIDQRGEAYWKQRAVAYEATARARLTEAEAEQKNPPNKERAAELKKRVTGLKAQLDTPGPGTAYERAAFQLLTDKNLCISCHDIGPITTPSPKGPNLALSADRLRPEWTEQWIANPRRVYAYSPLMPQNFPNAASRLEWQYQELFAGSPLEQSRAARDLIMDLPRLMRLAPTYKAPPPIPTGEEAK